MQFELRGQGQEPVALQQVRGLQQTPHQRHHLKLALLACLLLGIGIGALFPLSLIVAMDHLDDPAQAGMLAAFVQGGGYLIASFMPLLAGILRDRFASLTEAWIVMLAGAVVLLALAMRFSPASYRRIDAG